MVRKRATFSEKKRSHGKLTQDQIGELKKLTRRLPTPKETCPELYEKFLKTYEMLLKEHGKKVDEYIKSYSFAEMGKKSRTLPGDSAGIPRIPFPKIPKPVKEKWIKEAKEYARKVAETLAINETIDVLKGFAKTKPLGFPIDKSFYPRGKREPKY